ncbi:MAG TPA: nuclear transport factor 2 family protein [Polyangiaceae bacterium]
MFEKLDGSWGRRWVDAWNSHDLEAVLAHYVDDCTFVSPKAAAIAGSGVIRGKDALRAYWTKALEKFPGLKFSLKHAVFDEKERTIAIVYECALEPGTTPPVLACEVLSFGEAAQAVRGEAFYGAQL